MKSPSSAIPPRLRLLQSFDRALGGALCRVLPPRARALPVRDAPLRAAETHAILVIRPGGLGDAILLRPMLRVLREAYPGAVLDVLGERRNAAALRLGDPGYGVYSYDDGTAGVLRQIRAARYDLIVDSEQYHHLPVLLANWLRPRWLCGFDTLGRRRFHTHSVAHSEDDYEVFSFLRLAEAVTGRASAFDPAKPFIDVDAGSLAWADAALGPAAGRPVVAIMPGAGGAYRLWPTTRYAEVGRELSRRGHFVVLLGGTDAVAAAGEIMAACAPGSCRDLSGATTLARTAGVLRRARLSISSDTGVLHLAHAVGTPTVALFGPGLHRKWAPRGDRHRVVRLGLPCSPCTRHGRVPPCPIDVACMRDLDVPQVLGAIEELLHDA